MVLYDFFRSSAAYRVRIALNLKGLEYRQVPVDLRSGRQRTLEYLQRNPQGLVPALELDDGTVVSQSLPICELLEELWPEPALLPGEPTDRARIRSFAASIACDIHPLNNLRVLNYLSDVLQVEKGQKLAWYRHWIEEGLRGLEGMLEPIWTARGREGPWAFGDVPTLADVCLVPQLFNARRFECDLAPYPRLRRVDETAGGHPAFARAHPARQADAL